MAEANNKSLTVREVITFGNYEQDNNIKNGKEPTEWIVLSVEDDRALLLAKYGLDTKRFNNTLSYATWETCTLRQWLNTDFCREAFSDNELSRIITVSVPNGPEQCHKDHPIFGIPDTEDKIYLLSYSELKKYIPDEEERLTTATPYALSNGAYIMQKDNPSEYVEWLIRTVSDSKKAACVSNHNGAFYYGYKDLDYLGFCIRPSCWIKLDTSENTEADEEPLEVLFSEQDKKQTDTQKQNTDTPPAETVATTSNSSSFSLNSGLTFGMTREEIEKQLRKKHIYSAKFEEYSKQDGGFDSIVYYTKVADREDTDVYVSLDGSGRSFIIRYAFPNKKGALNSDSTAYQSMESMLRGKYGEPEYRKGNGRVMPFEKVELTRFSPYAFPVYTFTSLEGRSYNAEADKTYTFSCPQYSQWVVKDDDGYVIIEHVVGRWSFNDGYYPQKEGNDSFDHEYVNYIHLTNSEYTKYFESAVQETLGDL